jgi:hypothetical protein
MLHTNYFIVNATSLVLGTQVSECVYFDQVLKESKKELECVYIEHALKKFRKGFIIWYLC